MSMKMSMEAKSSLASHVMVMLGIPGYMCMLLSFLILCSLILGWMQLARCRSLTAKRIRNARNHIILGHNKPADDDDDASSSFPSLAVILPVRSLKPHSIARWKRQLAVRYRGQINFTFVVESKTDPAYDAIRDEIIINNNNNNNNSSRENFNANANIIVAGCCCSNVTSLRSQKIHNQLAALSQTSSELVLFLDDDMELPSHALEAAAHVLLTDKRPSLCVTGYPCDYVADCQAPVWAHAAAAYRKVLSIPYGFSDAAGFVWGGFMLMHRSDARDVAREWSAGGYSDDLVVAGVAANTQRVVLTPYTLAFPTIHDSTTSWIAYWNYLRRQCYTCFTYTNATMHRVNATMAAVHVALSLLTGIGATIAVTTPGWPLVAFVLITLASAASIRSADLAVWELYVTGCRAAARVAPGAWHDVDAATGFSPPPTSLVPYVKTAVAVVFHQFVIAAAFAVTFFRSDVVWGGRRYWCKGGRLSKVDVL